MDDIMHFRDYAEMRAFYKGPRKYTEPERIGEVKDEVSPEQPDKRKSKANARKVGKSAENTDKG